MTYSPLCAELALCQATTKDINALFPGVTLFARESKPTSAGRHVLALTDPELEDAVRKGHFECLNLSMIEFLLEFAPDRIPALFPVLLKEQRGLTNNEAAAALLLRKRGKRFEKDVYAFFKSMKDPWRRFQLAQAFFEFDPAKYRDDALEAARRLPWPAHRTRITTGQSGNGWSRPLEKRCSPTLSSISVAGTRMRGGSQ